MENIKPTNLKNEWRDFVIDLMKEPPTEENSMKIYESIYLFWINKVDLAIAERDRNIVEMINHLDHYDFQEANYETGELGFFEVSDGEYIKANDFINLINSKK